ncbi:MAG: HIT domain-containing protein [Actinomycetota bacterium]
MDRLWSPWRMEYIEQAHGDEDVECIFCELLGRDDDGKSLVLARAPHAFALLNAYPYNPGHLMVAPTRHVAELDGLSEDELLDAGRLLQRAVRALREEMDPHGYNVGMNLGKVAGAGVPGHLHWHAVPRWNGDTNFMPVVGHTRVLPESLHDTYNKLKPRFEKGDQ